MTKHCDVLPFGQLVQACLNVAHVTKIPNLRKIRFTLKPNLRGTECGFSLGHLRVKHLAKSNKPTLKPMKPHSRATPFQNKYFLEYGLQVVTRDVNTHEQRWQSIQTIRAKGSARIGRIELKGLLDSVRFNARCFKSSTCSVRIKHFKGPARFDQAWTELLDST